MTVAAPGHSAWLRRYEQASPNAVPLVCLPHAGGSASYFVPLARALAPAVDVVCVQYPGRQDRHGEPALTSIEALADQVFAALEPLRDRPLVLFGHSMGAVLGYELTRRLERRGGSAPLGLIVSGRRAPVRHRVETVHLRDDDGLLAEIRELNGTELGVLDDEELLRMVLPALRADYQAVETYRHRSGEPLSTPISVLVGESDPRVTLDEARAWKEMTVGAFAFRSFPGGHFYLNAQQAAVTRAITESLDAFRAG
ncbi:oleoyl-ACP hydrolase [Wenjunlia vitaminophila]|uniref:Oleoyl-ACP hydrolase n=1 Tax=Wenjunlia vitaminophila TaxID=76728 RepID=A0A0T6LWQ1_WENVI|nr:alpha/beta fold hydrolase [Wenjunlia vitaminophila]KRV50448.1 oleoyl-ACP hydrolase [Wenjunlia vitaminophila]